MDEWPVLDFDFDAKIESLKCQLSKYQKEETEINDRLEGFFKQASTLPKNLSLVISRAKNRLTVAESDARQLGSLLQVTSSMADHVSGKVSIYIYMIRPLSAWRGVGWAIIAPEMDFRSAKTRRQEF